MSTNSIIESILTWFSTRNWPLTVEVIKNVLTAMAAFAGFLALRSWQRELIGTDQYDTAKKISIYVNSLSNMIGWSKAQMKWWIDMANTPQGYATTKSAANSKNEPFAHWKEISELKSLIWQSSLLGMPSCEQQLKAIDDSHYEIVTAQIRILRALNETSSMEEAGPRLNPIAIDLDNSLAQINSAQQEILKLEQPYIMFKRTKLFSLIKRRKKAP